MIGNSKKISCLLRIFVADPIAAYTPLDIFYLSTGGAGGPRPTGVVAGSLFLQLIIEDSMRMANPR